MTTTSSVSNVNPDVTKVASKASSTVSKAVNGALNQAQFLKLMTTQMTHQDPAKPMQNGEFLTQMAQFGTVSGIQDLQKSFSDFASSVGSGQSLQAASLVGHSVMVPSSQGVLEVGKTVKGQVTLAADALNLTVKVVNHKTGELVKSVQLGPQKQGTVPLSWDGTTDKGTMAVPGLYDITATMTDGAKDTMLDTQIQSQVQSVTMGNGSTGIQLNLAGGNSVNFNKVSQIF
jgi:flagellar basal-body rod modification protein FlgD